MQSAVLETPATRASSTTERYAKCIEASKRIRWDIDRDVIRGREFDFSKKFMPDGLSKIRDLPFLRPAEARFLSQVQGRTYANMFALVERFIGAKTIELSKAHCAGRPGRAGSAGPLHRRGAEAPGAVPPARGHGGQGHAGRLRVRARAERSRRRGAVEVQLGRARLTLDIEIFSQAHYRASIEPDADLSDLWKDVFLFHWKEESQHAIMDEIEWRAEHARLTPRQRDEGVTDLIALVASVDGIVQAQAAADARYFIACAGPAYSPVEQAMIEETFLRAYRWQYIVSGAAGAALRRGAEGACDAGADGAHRRGVDADRRGGGLIMATAHPYGRDVARERELGAPVAAAGSGARTAVSRARRRPARPRRAIAVAGRACPLARRRSGARGAAPCARRRRRISSATPTAARSRSRSRRCIRSTCAA